MQHTRATTIRKRVSALRPGDVVLLAGCPITDPNLDPTTPSTGLVSDVTSENASCMAVTFVGFDVVGYPPSHEIEVVTSARGLAA